MNTNGAQCEVMPFPRLRQMMVDGGRISAGRHAVHGLVEADVTLPRQMLREHKARTGETVSFTAFLLFCLGRAVEADKRVHACRDWRNRLYIFDEVNVNTSFAAEGGRAAHLTHIMKAVNKRGVREIHDDIRKYQSVGSKSEESRWIEGFVRLPWFARRAVYAAVMHNPRLQLQYFGTASLTSVGMFGKGGGWAIPFLIASLGVAVGGISQKPGWVDGRVEPREYLSITVSFDHDIVDGVPATRFASHFAELIECASGLGEALSC